MPAVTESISASTLVSKIRAKGEIVKKKRVGMILAEQWGDTGGNYWYTVLDITRTRTQYDNTIIYASFEG